MADDFKFQKLTAKPRWIKDGITFGKDHAFVSRKIRDLIKMDDWQRIDVLIDFKKNAMAINRNDAEGMLSFKSKRGVFAVGGFSEKVKRGHYRFLKQDGDLYIFLYDKKSSETR